MPAHVLHGEHPQRTRPLLPVGRPHGAGDGARVSALHLLLPLAPHDGRVLREPDQAHRRGLQAGSPLAQGCRRTAVARPDTDAAAGDAEGGEGHADRPAHARHEHLPGPGGGGSHEDGRRGCPHVRSTAGLGLLAHLHLQRHAQCEDAGHRTQHQECRCAQARRGEAEPHRKDRGPAGRRAAGVRPRRLFTPDPRRRHLQSAAPAGPAEDRPQAGRGAGGSGPNHRRPR